MVFCYVDDNGRNKRLPLMKCNKPGEDLAETDYEWPSQLEKKKSQIGKDISQLCGVKGVLSAVVKGWAHDNTYKAVRFTAFYISERLLLTTKHSGEVDGKPGVRRQKYYIDTRNTELEKDRKFDADMCMPVEIVHICENLDVMLLKIRMDFEPDPHEILVPDLRYLERGEVLYHVSFNSTLDEKKSREEMKTLAGICGYGKLGEEPAAKKLDESMFRGHKSLSVGLLGREDGDEIHYYSCSSHGASGSPVFLSGSKNAFIGVHGGGKHPDSYNYAFHVNSRKFQAFWREITKQESSEFLPMRKKKSEVTTHSQSRGSVNESSESFQDEESTESYKTPTESTSLDSSETSPFG